MLAKIVDYAPQMLPSQIRQDRTCDPSFAVHNHCFGVIDYPPAGLAHAETQVNILGAIKNSLVQESHLCQSRPANDLTRTNDIIDFPHAIMIPVGHLYRTAEALSKGERETSSELVTHGRKKSTGELELALQIDKFRAAQAYL